MAAEFGTEQGQIHAECEPINETSPLISSLVTHQVDVDGDPHHVEGIDGDTNQTDGDLCEIPRPLVWLLTILSYIFTDLPWETINYINMPDKIPQETILKPQKHPCTYSCSLVSLTKAVGLFILVLTLRLSFILGAIFTQLMTCFRRDWTRDQYKFYHGFK